MAAKKAIFIDKDGTLIPDIPYNVKVDLITLSADMIDGLQLLIKEGYVIIVISNQPGIGMGLYGHEDLLNVGRHLEIMLSSHGIILSGFYYCPHSPKMLDPLFGGCKCRKPKPGLLWQAAKEHNIDLDLSWMLGDILNDMEAGNSAGCKTILINNGNETEWIVNDERTPDFLSPTINAAANYILDINKLMNGYGRMARL